MIMKYVLHLRSILQLIKIQKSFNRDLHLIAPDGFNVPGITRALNSRINIFPLSVISYLRGFNQALYFIN